MKENYVRITLDIPVELYDYLERTAGEFVDNTTVNDYLLRMIELEVETIKMEDQRDLATIEEYERRLERGEIKTLSHEEMMKRLGWDSLDDTNEL